MANETLNLNSVIAEINRHGEAGRKAAKLAINTASEQARTEAAQHIAKRYALPAGYSSSRIQVIRYATEKNLESEISTPRQATLLSRFNNAQLYQRGKTVPRKNAGIQVTVLRSNGPQKLGRAFYMNLKNGNKAIAIRKSKRRKDIKVLYGPSVASAFKWLRDKSQLSETLLKNTKNEFFRYLDKV